MVTVVKNGVSGMDMGLIDGIESHTKTGHYPTSVHAQNAIWLQAWDPDVCGVHPVDCENCESPVRCRSQLSS